MSKTILITGASAGFGFDAARTLAARGHAVYATMRGIDGKNADKARELTEYADKGGYSLTALDLDVTDDASAHQAIATAVDAGGFDVLVNNAGVGNLGIDETFTVDQARRLFDVNLFGVMRVNRAALPHLRERGQGRVVYISSGLGRFVFPFMAIYSASKFALEALAEATSYELAPAGIESVIMQPGAFGTDFVANCMQPETEPTGAYGKTVDMFRAFTAAFQDSDRAEQVGDPRDLVAALVEEIERPAGARRLVRRPVGTDAVEPVGAINNTCAGVQQALLAPFGID